MQTQVRDVGFGYAPYPHELSRDRSVSLQAKGLFAVYGSFVSVTDPTAWPSESYLCELCGGIGRDTFRKYKRELVRSGWISQEQRHNERGQYSTCLVTRYYHPTMNPFFSVKSTDVEKPVVGKPDGGKPVVHNKNHFQNKNQKNTQQPVVCVPRELNDYERAVIDWVVDQARQRGQLKNESGLRVMLVRAAQRGELDTSAYDRAVRANEGQKRALSDALQRVERWQAEAAADSVDRDWWAEQRRRFPGVFR